MTGNKISVNDVKKARAAFEANEPRNLFYRAATELVDLALRGATSLTVAEALAVLLQTWNKAYYQYRKFDNTHFANIENLLCEHELALASYRRRTIVELDDMDGTSIENLFQSFERLLGPVGAAKALHLLAPGFFPSLGSRHRRGLQSRTWPGRFEWRPLLAVPVDLEAAMP